MFTEDGSEKTVATVAEALSLPDGAFVSLRPHAKAPCDDPGLAFPQNEQVEHVTKRPHPQPQPQPGPTGTATSIVTVAGMSAADSCEQRLCRAAAMQSACTKQLQSVCAEASALWRPRLGSAMEPAASIPLRKALDELSERSAAAAAALAQLDNPELCVADSGLAVALAGIFERALVTLKELREEAEGVVIATEVNMHPACVLI